MKEEKPTIEELRSAFRATTERHRRRKPPQWKTKTCERCGIEMSVLCMRQKYCNDCAKLLRLESTKSANAKRNVKRKAKADENREKEKPRVSHINDIQQAARKAGMSYGRYVAIIAMKKGKKEE